MERCAEKHEKRFSALEQRFVVAPTHHDHAQPVESKYGARVSRSRKWVQLSSFVTKGVRCFLRFRVSEWIWTRSLEPLYKRETLRQGDSTVIAGLRRWLEWEHHQNTTEMYRTHGIAILVLFHVYLTGFTNSVPAPSSLQQANSIVSTFACC